MNDSDRSAIVLFVMVSVAVALVCACVAYWFSR